MAPCFYSEREQLNRHLNFIVLMLRCYCIDENSVASI
jgi:hypothetical protein